jgi:arylsulfatase A-like enzyme
LRAAAQDAKRSPNFIIVMADDLGYGDLSVYDGWIETPHLDRMAAEGLRFTDFHSSGAVCSPTRAGLMTGRYQQRAGIPGVVFADPEREEHDDGLQPAEVTFAEVLGQAGYRTAMFGKWHLGYLRKYNPIHQGFDQFRGFVSGNVDYFSHVDQVGNYDWWNGAELVNEHGYTTKLVTKHALRFIENKRDQPFCLYMAYAAPHSPYQGPDGAGFRIPGRSMVFQDRDTTRMRSAYRQMVQVMDDGLGQVMAKLERLELARETFVLFFSDNGASPRGSNRPLRGHKGTVWEGGHRVPAIAWWPGRIEAGRITSELAISLDVMPTLLDLAGVDGPSNRVMDGMSLAPLLFEDASDEERQLFWHTGISLPCALGRGSLCSVHRGNPATDSRRCITWSKISMSPTTSRRSIRGGFAPCVQPSGRGRKTWKRLRHRSHETSRHETTTLSQSHFHLRSRRGRIGFCRCREEGFGRGSFFSG